MNELCYEPLSAAHFEVMARLWSDPEVIRYTAVERPCTPAQSRLRMEALLEGQQGLPVPTIYLVRCKGEPCGVAGAPPLGKGWRRFGFFYQFLPGFWGRGIGGEAAAWLAARMRESYPRAELAADAVERNAASLRILERAGFLPCGVRQGSFERDGLRLDILSFRLPAPEANASSAAYPSAEPELSMRKKRSGKVPERFSPLESGNGLSGP